MRLVSVVFAVCALVALPRMFGPSMFASSAAAAPQVRFGIQDDAWLESGPGRLSDRVARLDRLGLDVVRITLQWHRTEGVQGRYDWRRSDRLLRALDAQGLDPVVTLWGTPEWASDGAANTAPRNADDFASFARAAATRYPFVRHWTIWNEPNKIIWLKPVSPQLYVSRILNPGYQAIKDANPSAKVAGGVTAPRGGKGGMAPVDFIRGMDRAGARLDAYAHHPYPDYPGDTPYRGGCQHCKTISMSTLERLLREAGKAFPKARIWTMLPLAQVSRNGALTTAWGQVRPGTGQQRYVLQSKTAEGWEAVGGVRLTSSRGYFRRTVHAPKGSQLRIWYPARGLASPALSVR